MKIDPRLAKVLSVFVVILTGSVVAWTTVALGFATLFTTFIRRMFEVKEGIESVQRIGLIISAVLVPAILLLPFYCTAIFQTCSRRFLVTGWIGSAIYHAAVLWLIATHLSGTIQSGGVQVPSWSSSLIAVLLSIGLALQNPQKQDISVVLPSGNDTSGLR